jgi:hypothetical protein
VTLTCVFRAHSFTRTGASAVELYTGDVLMVRREAEDAQRARMCGNIVFGVLRRTTMQAQFPEWKASFGWSSIRVSFRLVLKTNSGAETY